MRHEYDDEQINDASRTAANYGSCGESHSNYLRRFLDALPEPDQQDDWQECTFEDIRKGDRVKEVVNQGHGTIETIEGVAHFKAPGTGGHRAWKPRGTAYQLALGDYASDSHKVTLYRIPAPVEHPDPALHQFIRVDGKDYKAIPESGRYQLLEAGLATVHVINRENIAEWTELELVPKVVADNDC